jgi:hypothetical protein
MQATWSKLDAVIVSQEKGGAGLRKIGSLVESRKATASAHQISSSRGLEEPGILITYRRAEFSACEKLLAG